ncbi:MAG: hypothetical protein SWK76_00490 [Actinomycetota bacterium]|nr:hypothetical protein [Actinomycetota bacterium]
MRKLAILFLSVLVVALSVAALGCGDSETPGENGNTAEEQYELGYLDGYDDGYEDGYADGYDDALAEDGGQDETAEVEAAMLAFVKQGSVEGLEFEITDIVIHGDDAAGIAVCTNEEHENALVIMEKGAAGWYGVDFGTGIEAPSWYQP